MLKLGNFLFHYRNAVFPLVFIAALLLARPTFPWGSERLDGVLDLLGFAVALAGQALRVLTIGYRYIRRGGKQQRIYADDLVQGGVFAHSRNPLYLGNFLMFLGILLIVNDPLLYLLGIPLCLLVYGAIIVAEEDYLGRKFGADYQDYCRRVNRVWPNWHGFSDSVTGMVFDWKQVLRKEYSTTFAWLLAVSGLHWWSRYQVLGAPALPTTATLVIWSVLLGTAYLLVRWLKKTGQLE
jgi:protein-S-isoprenylcysteine O-methyltransferase Ste14